jgi:hypothetical protein
MTRRERLVVLVAVIEALLAIPLIIGAIGARSRASATTGDTYLLPPAKYQVPASVMSNWYGEYASTSIDKRARLIEVDMFITKNQYNDLYGGGSFYGYDSQGTQDSWTEVLYDFKLLSPQGQSPAACGASTPSTPKPKAGRPETMAITLYGWGSPSLGSLRLTRQGSGNLTGTIQLKGQRQTYAISFKKVANR